MRVILAIGANGAQPRCTVAVLAALGVPDVDPKRARDGWDVLDCLRAAGLCYRPVSFAGRNPTVREFVREREGKPGRYYFFTAGHALALIDGDTLVDTSGRGLSDRIRVRGAVEILPSEAP